MNLNQKIIIARIVGGIGNQLFTYAAARRLALINNAELIIDDSSGFVHDYKFNRSYQLENFNIPCRKATDRECLEPFSSIRRYIKRRWNQYLPFERRKYLIQEKLDFDERLLYYIPEGQIYFEGYWQSEDYFKDIDLTIRQELKIKPPTDSANLNLANEIEARNAVAIHVRFFDEKIASDPKNPLISYYHRALEEMQSREPDAHYYLFSDRPDWARSIISLSDECVTVVDHNRGDKMASADLWLMTLCRHFIIANSTFSWWGAWLSPHKEKVIIAPKFKKLVGDGAWGFKGLIPENWLGIDL